MVNLHDLQMNMSKLKNWSVEGSTIVKEKFFQTPKEAFEFVAKVREVGEKNNHYPDIVIQQNNVRIILSTKGMGPSEIDFKVAEEIDKIG